MKRWRWWVVALVLMLAVALWVRLRMMDPHAEVTDYEIIPPGEADAIARLVRQATDVIARDAVPDHLYKRDAHAQPHGCMRAVLRVNDDIAKSYRHGVFTTPGREYQAWVRFSNGTEARDTNNWLGIGDARGMAIKLMGVAGEKLLHEERDEQTQDFVMINYPAFFVRDVVQYEKFFAQQAAGTPQRYFLGLNPLDWRLHELYHAAGTVRQEVASPLAAQYYSMSPYRLGRRATKFSARPCRLRNGVTTTTALPGSGCDSMADACAPVAAEMPDKPRPHYLRAALVQHLEQAGGCFDFMVQLQDLDVNMPIEDPTVEWREYYSPYRPVALLYIPQQTFTSDRQNRFCEALSFTPWHSLPEHRPLGGINRSRKAVYENVSRRRHYCNGAARTEPVGWDVPALAALEPPPCDPGASREDD